MLSMNTHELLELHKLGHGDRKFLLATFTLHHIGYYRVCSRHVSFVYKYHPSALRLKMFLAICGCYLGAMHPSAPFLLTNDLLSLLLRLKHLFVPLAYYLYRFLWLHLVHQQISLKLRRRENLLG